MRFVADLHIHSLHSRATSRDCDLENLAWWAARKGISVIGTGDFTHPAWFAELQEKLVPAEPGLYRLRPDLEDAVLKRLPSSCRTAVRFMLSVEISTIYKRDDRTRKVHHLLYMPDIESASNCRNKLDSIGNIKSDGRPILGLDSRHLLEITLENNGYLVPAHIWTPWFAVMGSMSGFDYVDDCYGELAPNVFAVETGLSSDPEMNWRVSSLDRFSLVSNSDAHSPPALGREATVFDTEIDYFAIKNALETGDGLHGTIEFFPEEGKYHLDGHRKCDVVWEPHETKAHNRICTSCEKPVTVGVSHRVDDLADRPLGYKPPNAKPFASLVSLAGIVGEINKVGPKSKRVTQEVIRLEEALGPELQILQTVPFDDIAAVASPLLVEAIYRLRNGQVIRKGGFDGEYGVIRMFEPDEIERRDSGVLFDIPLISAKPKAYVKTTKVAPEPTPINLDDLKVIDLEPGLNSKQKQAVQTTDGALVIIAGPGTGKTKVITERIAGIVHSGVDPRKCLAITFTRRAANELRERLATTAATVNATTFHALGIEILRAHWSDAGLTENFRISNTFDQVDKSQSPRDVVDFDDLIDLPLQLLKNEEIATTWQQRYEYICVDEFQDIDLRQLELVKALVGTKQNICVVGDPDQSIYAFRGADANIFDRFKEQFLDATEVTLDINYRSSPVIVAASSSAIKPSTLVPNRQLKSARNEETAAPSVSVYEAKTEGDEAVFVSRTVEQLIGGTSLHSFDTGTAEATDLHISFADIAVLYRTDAQAAAIQDAFHRSGIPAQKRSHNKLIDHKLVSGFARYLSASQSDESIHTHLELFAGHMQQFAELEDLLNPLIEQCNEDRQMFLSELALGAEIDTWDPRADRVSLLTLHAAKGLEFPVVFIVGANDGLIPLRFGPNTNEPEERRLFYVGMTRAQSHLYVTHSKTRTRNGKIQEMTPTPFLRDVPVGLIDVAKPTFKAKQAKQLSLL